VHGLTHRRQAWYPVLDRLVEHRRVFLIDLPGHGESSDLVITGGDVQGSLRRALTDFMDLVGLERPHIAGNSLGGRIALEAAADGLVRSATTLSPAAFWYGGLDFLYVRNAFRALTASARVLRPVSPLLTRFGTTRHLLLSPIATHGERLPAAGVMNDMRGMRRALPAMRTIFPAAEPFHRAIPADIPVTIAWGAKDHILLPYQARIAARRIPGARHLWLPDCGHVPMADDPALVARVLLEGSRPAGVTLPGAIA